MARGENTMEALRIRNKEIRKVKVTDILENPHNYRTHGDFQKSVFADVIDDIGFFGYPDVYEPEPGKLMLVDGALRRQHLIDKYGKDAQIEVNVTDFDEEEAKKALATNDPIAALAGVEQATLDKLLEDIEFDSPDINDMITLLQAEEDAIVEDILGDVVEDEIPELPVDPITQPGDLWILGDHRLLCGDATNSEDVERLMDGKKADAVVTDPPYGIDKYKCCKGIDGAAKRSDFDAMEGDSTIDVAERVINNIDWDQPAIVWGANYYPTSFPSGFGWIVWDKVREGETFSGAELAFSNVGIRVDIFRHQWHGMIKESERGEARVHPTQKPVALFAYCLKRVGDKAVLIYDPFLGSGTTIIAAEQLGRKCYGMELSPVYCDVVVARWESLTGKKAELQTE